MNGLRAIAAVVFFIIGTGYLIVSVAGFFLKDVPPPSNSLLWLTCGFTMWAVSADYARQIK